MGKNSFLMYTSYREHLALLSGDDFKKTIMALFDYAERGVEPELDGVAKVNFVVMRSQLDRDNEKYQHRCEKNLENIRKRWNTKDTNVYDRIPTNTKRTDDDNDDGNDNDDDINTPQPPVAKKKPPQKKYAEFVSMTEKEYETLVAEYGRPKADGCIRILDNYKGSSGKKYKSDYRAILNWVLKRYDEENPGPTKPSGGPHIPSADEVMERMGMRSD